MTLEDNLTIRVQKSNVRNTSSAKLAINLAFTVCSVVVFNTVLVASFDDPALKFIGILINTQTDESDLVLPGFFALGEHFNVMLHGALAWRAPSGPKIEENDFTLVVLESDVIVSNHFTIFKLERSDVFDGINLVTDAILAFNFNRDSCVSILADLLDFFFDLFALCFF